MDKKLNFIMISPHFPENFTTFAPRLKEAGFNTLGIADVSYDDLSESLRTSLTEYYRVDDMEDYEQVYRAVAYFIHKYGRIHRIESHNEHWLELDARLRTDFNVFGYKISDLDGFKRKSSMKEVFRSIGLPVAEGRVFSDKKDGLKLAKKLGFPVIVKPDSGVGAGDTYKIKTKEELEGFFENKNSNVIYIMEEFIPGELVTFDGLTDQDGNIVFYSTFSYCEGVLETVENDSDTHFFLSREVPEDLIAMGTKMVKAFDVKERFFHFEFFRTEPDGKLMPLEVNLRPPGGPVIDMFNYVNDFDIFKEYANVSKENQFYAPAKRLHYCGFATRKYGKYTYAHSRDEIREKLGDGLIQIQKIPDIFFTIFGDEGYLFRSPSKDQLFEYIEFISKKQ